MLKKVIKRTPNDFNQAHHFVKNTYQSNTKLKTVTRDYPDVVRRLFIISGFITIRFGGKKMIQIIHQDVKEFFDYSIVKSRSNSYKVMMKPYDLKQFVNITRCSNNLEDMERYTEKTIADFKRNLSKIL